MPIIKFKARLAFPSLFVPREAKEAGKPPRFEAHGIFEPGSESDLIVKGAMEQAARDKWGEKWQPILEKLKADGRVCYHTSPKTNDNGEVYDGFQGMHWIKATNEARPAVIDKDTSPLTQQHGRPYSGCNALLNVEIWAQDNSWGRRINGKLRWVQYHSEGEAFSGGAPVSQDEFQAIADGATAGDLV